MGIYDTVKFVGFCPRCGARCNDWQTKEPINEDPCMTNRHVCEARSWYGECPDCGLWISYRHSETQAIGGPSRSSVEIITTYTKNVN